MYFPYSLSFILLKREAVFPTKGGNKSILLPDATRGGHKYKSIVRETLN